MCPFCTLFRPAINFRSVVLPLPDGPRIQAMESFLSSKLTLFKIDLLLILWLRFFIFTANIKRL
jgi:hypothetical protein